MSKKLKKKNSILEKYRSFTWSSGELETGWKFKEKDLRGASKRIIKSSLPKK